MNYSRIYEQLIDRARNRVPEGYVERHHVVPRCMGGSDENSNLVALTPEEHFTAHVLLVKMYPEVHGLINAVNKMCRGKHRKRNKMYGWLKRRFAEEQSRSQSGSGNSQHGLMWVCNIETKQNRKVPKDSVLEEGWVKGRNRWNRVCIGCSKPVEKTVCPECKASRKAEAARKSSRTQLARPDHSAHLRKTTYYTNGVSDIRLREGKEVPEGFRKGRSFGGNTHRPSDRSTMYSAATRGSGV